MTTTQAAADLNRKEEALWLFQRFAPAATVDNLPLAIRTSVDIDPSTLEAATGAVLRRYPALRTKFPARHGVPRRQVVAPAEAAVAVESLAVPADRLGGTLTELAQRPFDLRRDLPLRVFRIALHEGGSVLGLVSHHIVFDGASGGVVMPELATTYWRMAAGQPVATAPGPLEALADAPPSPESLAYWVDSLAGLDTGRLALPAARPEPAHPTFAGARIERELSASAQAGLRVLRTRLRITENMVLLAAYFALLARHGAGPDLVVAVPVNLRSRAMQDAVGYHVSTLPVRVRADLGRGFDDLAQTVRERLVAGLDHADVSFESLLGELRLTNPSWRVPLHRHMFNFLPQALVAAPGELPDSAWVTVDPGTSRNDLQFLVLRSASRISIQVVYSTEIHDEEYVRSLADRYELLLAAAAAEPRRPLAELDLWTGRDRQAVERANAGGAAAVPAPTAPALIGQRLTEEPESAAVVEPDGRVHTRHSVAGSAAVLRHELAAAGVHRGDVVALALPRGADLAAAVLATWSLGAAYLPLDPAQPSLRLRDQLERAGTRVVVSDAALPADGLGSRRLVIPAASASPADDPEQVAALRAGLAAAEPDELAYVIFTSGSTGRPKGVEIAHRNLANVVRHFAGELAMTARTRVLWLTTFGFDISALEVTLGLCHGGGVVAAPDEAQLRPAVLLDLVRRHDVTVAQATPTIWRLVATELTDELAGRTVLCGGEPLSATLAERLLRSGCRLFNVYGPTETTIWSTSAPICAPVADPVGIGAPIAETALYVLDEYGLEAPPGIVGELCIAGTGVARGYLGAPELTEQRFPTDARRGRHYRTGDLATWRGDGTITLVGRVDRQVKLRGRRIELGEIEAVLEQHPDVAAVAVVVRGDPQGDGRLVGYLQPAGDGLDLDAVRRSARAALPYYLLPADLVILPALPRNPNGKVDYQALPEVAPQLTAAEIDEPTDPLVVRLAALWREVLGREDLGASSNFFASGGHSLLAAILAARVGEELDLAVSLMDVFDAPTPLELAALLREAGHADETEVGE